MCSERNNSYLKDHRGYTRDGLRTKSCRIEMLIFGSSEHEREQMGLVLNRKSTVPTADRSELVNGIQGAQSLEWGSAVCLTPRIATWHTAYLIPWETLYHFARGTCLIFLLHSSYCAMPRYQYGRRPLWFNRGETAPDFAGFLSMKTGTMFCSSKVWQSANHPAELDIFLSPLPVDSLYY